MGIANQVPSSSHFVQTGERHFSRDTWNAVALSLFLFFFLSFFIVFFLLSCPLSDIITDSCLSSIIFCFLPSVLCISVIFVAVLCCLLSSFPCNHIYVFWSALVCGVCSCGRFERSRSRLFSLTEFVFFYIAFHLHFKKCFVLHDFLLSGAAYTDFITKVSSTLSKPDGSMLLTLGLGRFSQRLQALPSLRLSIYQHLSSLLCYRLSF